MDNDCDVNKHDGQSSADAGAAEEEKYLDQLIAERKQLDPSLTLSAQLLDREITRLQSKQESDRYIELHHDKPTKMTVKVRVPVKEFPKFNFVGKILGPKGNSLKRIQEETGTRMAVFGRGSMRDKQKEEELRKEGGKYSHLNEDLHVSVEVFAHPIECYSRLSYALFKLRQHLVPDYNDDISQSQVQELRYLNGEASFPVPRGRGAPPPPVGEFHGGIPRGGRGGNVHRGAFGSMPYGRGGGIVGSLMQHTGSYPGWSPRLPAAASVPLSPAASSGVYSESNSHQHF